MAKEYPDKVSIDSHLTEKAQSSLTSECENDDDFLPDRKRIRTADHKVTLCFFMWL